MDNLPASNPNDDGWEIVTDEVLDNDNKNIAIYVHNLCSESCRDAYTTYLAEQKEANAKLKG
jgi:hypothetical protein